MDNQRYTLEKTISDCDATKGEVPSFIESNLSYPYGFRRLPDDQTKPKRLFEDDSESSEEPELVQVYLRLKPCKGVNDLYQVKSDRCLVTSLDTATAGHGRRTQHHVSKLYTFSHIFRPNATQKQIFEHVVKDNLKKLSEGHSFTLLTYGASGSGKTYTLMGTVAAPGLVPRSLEYVFKIVDAAQEPRYKPVDAGAEKLSHSMQELEMKFVKNLRQVSAPLRDKYRRMSARLSKEMSTQDLTNGTQYFVWVSFVEIYNEAVYDLLVSSDRRTTSKLRIREDLTGHVYVKGATQVFVRSGEEAYDVMVAGKHNLQVAATGVHARSSRSHCIFTITLLAQSESSVRVSCVRLCDLAGAERAGRTQNRGARMQESRAINSSLHVLEKCLHALRRNQRAQLDANLVPYRESKLTRLLGGGLSGARGEAVSMVVTINPHPDDMHETKHVLQLANVARDIQVNNTIEETWSEQNSQNSTVCSSAEVMELRTENERLHFELAQAHARCKNLMAELQQNRQHAATRMTQLVNDAKDFTSQYYESMIASMEERHRSELREYENKLQAAGISNITTRVKQRLMSDRFSQNSSFTEEDEMSEQISELSTRSQNKTLNDESVSTEANANRESLLVLSDNYSSDDEANESLEPNFKMQKDLNLTKRPSDNDNSTNVEDSLLKDNTIDEESSDNESVSILDDDDMSSQSEFLVETNNSKSSIINNNAQPKIIKVESNDTEHNPPNNEMSTEVNNLEKLVNQTDNKLVKNRSPSIVNSPSPVTVKKKNAKYIRNNDEIDKIRKNLANTSLTKIKSEVLLKDEQPTIPETLMAINPKENKVSVPVPDPQHVIQHQDAKTTTHETNNSNNTADDFENIYNDLSRTRATEFDLLVSQELSQTNINDAIKSLEASTLDVAVNKNSAKQHPQNLEKEMLSSEVKINREKQESDLKPLEIGKEAATRPLNLDSAANQPPQQDEVQNSLTTEEKPQSTEVKAEETKTKYKLRNKNNDLDVEDQEFQKIKEIISKPLTRRNLRLRRRKNENIPDITENVQSTDNAKLKDIVNLQKEYSDVTMNMPVTQKVTQDIPSPEKGEADENMAPSDAATTSGKSVTRSRRKLFTPRAEPLEDSPPQTGDSNERIRAPRPSYHRPRARRKL